MGEVEQRGRIFCILLAKDLFENMGCHLMPSICSRSPEMSLETWMVSVGWIVLSDGGVSVAYGGGAGASILPLNLNSEQFVISCVIAAYLYRKVEAEKQCICTATFFSPRSIMD